MILRTYSLGRQIEEEVLQHVNWKFPLLAWAAWQLQFSPTSCGTLRKQILFLNLPPQTVLSLQFLVKVEVLSNIEIGVP